MNFVRLGAGLLFAVLVALGLWMAFHQPLWNDEYYSLTSSTLGTSYGKMLAGGIGEGNNSPLFYLLQKLQSDVIAYHAPQDWIDGRWNGGDVFSQVFLRIQPVVCMAASLSFLFYFFVSRYSLLAGWYALLVALTSFMLWAHWTEARPYALWFSLSILQMLVMIDILKESSLREQKHWHRLTGLHWLLALTATLSVIQITVAAMVIWLNGQRRWNSYIVTFVLPMMVCVYYYCHAPKYDFFFEDGPLALVNANIPKDRLLLLGVFAVIFAFQHRTWQAWRTQVEGKFLLFTSLMLLFFAFLLVFFKWKDAGHGFQISNRYFIPLTALGIVAISLFSVYLFKAFKSKQFRIAIALVLVFFLLFRLQKAFKTSIYPALYRTVSQG